MTTICRAQSVLLRASAVVGTVVSVGCVAEIPWRQEGSDVEQLSAELAKIPTIVAAKELFVTDLSVVNATKFVDYRSDKWNTDKDGGFSFARLVDNLSRVEKPSDSQRAQFVMNWLKSWETPQPIAGQTVAARPRIREVVITPWKLASVGKNGNTAASCSADVSTDSTCALSFETSVIPFRLLAVAYRPDLRLLPDPNDASSGSAGQGRFVFGVLAADKKPLPFTVIFEYIIPVSSKSDIKAVAEKYHELSKYAWGEDFNKKLHERTVDFTKWNIAPQRPNGSALSQIRTNEVALAGAGSDPTSPFGLMWELREFVIGSSGQLVLEPVKKEPALHFNNTMELGVWASFNQAGILSGNYSVPPTLDGQPFVAASSFTPFKFAWSVPGVDEPVRHALALNTCNGCHRSETGTFFLHVKNRLPDQVAALSPFLTTELAPQGVRVADLATILTTDASKIKKGAGKDGDDTDDD